MENPCHMCMPMGGIMALKGIEQTMVIVHGSQGCSTYMRRHIAEHFNEPVDVGSSSLNEKGTVYGGEANLRKALDNIFKVYQPGLIGVITTCLAETIGEDIDRIVTDYRQERKLTTPIVTASTPGYGGSHNDGYWLTVRRLVETLATNTEHHNKVNVIIPNSSPADIRELKRLFAAMQLAYTICPDISETLDRPYLTTYSKIPAGGTPIEDIRRMAGAPATIELGVTLDSHVSPGQYLQENFGVPLFSLPIPIGIQNTDTFMKALETISGRKRPPAIEAERGRLLDGMIDSHKYNFAGRSAIFGDPELVFAVTQLCLENGIRPVVVTGDKSGNVARLLPKNEISAATVVLPDPNFDLVQQYAKKGGVNLAIGHSDGRFLTERDHIPLVRLGFPIHDRIGGQRLLSVGYTGTMNLLDRITNTLLAEKYTHYRQTMYQKYYRKSS
ncbi:nitrogenase component 1 [Sporomusa acidovorans]|uniref:Nitrogenase molybdenum-iron protein beta chain n=1 Tax=Sporomusa acidovorans (strain ATCC 49682 / DSM 3132 / Mol) TaxID=1123286 RepID=A0ABZ3J9R1_SPOA4|nr:nitrogenase component 1 [Sporomusa acidovorans]OZC21827.1 nitrogenase molybdenum-iron protein beta chain [Sporomusa acidovorans DSM 3132]SDD55707.1 nitrogenase molybdenum-iron protein NifN [Sporomusa acidovorans]